VKTLIKEANRVPPAKGRRSRILSREAGAKARHPLIAGVMLAPLALFAILLRLPLPAAQAQESPEPLSLKQAVAAASGAAPSVSVATLRAAQADGRLAQARSVYWPSLGGSAGFVRQTLNEESFGITLPSPPGWRPIS